MNRAVRLVALAMLTLSASVVPRHVDASGIRPAAEGDVAAPDIGGVYTATDGSRWAIETSASGLFVAYAVAGGFCVTPGTLVSLGQWDGTAFAAQTPYYDLDPDTGACAGVSFDYSADRITPVNDRTVEWCTQDGGCLRMDRPVRYEVQLSAWIPHSVIADPYLPRPVEGLERTAIDLAPASVAPRLAADQVESIVPGQGHVGLAEPLLAVVTVAFTVTTLERLADVTWEVGAMALGRTVAGNFEDGSAVECTQAVTLAGLDVGRVSTMGPVIVMQINADWGIVPERRTDISSGESAVLRRLGCDGVDVSCDPHEQALGVGQLDANVVIDVEAGGTLGLSAATDAFPSYGLVVTSNGRSVTRTVLHDSSCYGATGIPGALNTVELLQRLEPRVSGPLAAWPNDTCERRRLQGDEVPPGAFDGTRGELATFLLGTRYADGRR